MSIHNSTLVRYSEQWIDPFKSWLFNLQMEGDRCAVREMSIASTVFRSTAIYIRRNYLTCFDAKLIQDKYLTIYAGILVEILCEGDTEKAQLFIAKKAHVQKFLKLLWYCYSVNCKVHKEVYLTQLNLELKRSQVITSLMP